MSELNDKTAAPRPETQKERWFKYGLNVLLVSLIVVVLAVLLIAFVQLKNVNKRFDTTTAGLYSLKPQTLNIIKNNSQDIRIVSLLLTRGREDEMLILRHVHSDVLQAAPARHFAGTAHASAEIEAARSCGGKPALDMNRRRGAHVSGLPHRIVG